MHSINLSFEVGKLSVGFGGTAGNIAYSLALLGVKSEVIATAGDDFGKYSNHLLQSGVNPSTIRVLEGDMTSSAYIFTDKADNQVAAFHRGAGQNAYDIPVDTDGRDCAIVSAGCPADMVMLPELYRRRGLKFFYDPGQAITSLSAEELRAGLSGAHILFATDYELGLIAQKTGWTENAMLEHVPTIVVTFGKGGSRIKTTAGDINVPALPARELVDPTGAGDAYRAGFIKGFLMGLPPESCARLGSAVAIYTVESYGTQNHRFTEDELKERYKKGYGETLVL